MAAPGITAAAMSFFLTVRSRRTSAIVLRQDTETNRDGAQGGEEIKISSFFSKKWGVKVPPLYAVISVGYKVPLGRSEREYGRIWVGDV